MAASCGEAFALWGLQRCGGLQAPPALPGQAPGSGAAKGLLRCTRCWTGSSARQRRSGSQAGARALPTAPGARLSWTGRRSEICQPATPASSGTLWLAQGPSLLPCYFISKPLHFDTSRDGCCLRTLSTPAHPVSHPASSNIPVAFPKEHPLPDCPLLPSPSYKPSDRPQSWALCCPGCRSSASLTALLLHPHARSEGSGTGVEGAEGRGAAGAPWVKSKPLSSSPEKAITLPRLWVLTKDLRSHLKGFCLFFFPLLSLQLLLMFGAFFLGMLCCFGVVLLLLLLAATGEFPFFWLMAR